MEEGKRAVTLGWGDPCYGFYCGCSGCNAYAKNKRQKDQNDLFLPLVNKTIEILQKRGMLSMTLIDKGEITSSVDLSKAKPGQKVEFRCGGEAEIIHISQYEYNYSVTLRADGKDVTRCYGENGAWNDCLLDIIAVEATAFGWKDARSGMAFDWKDVKPGMAFNHLNVTWVFVGRDPLDINAFVFSEKNHGFLKSSYEYSRIDSFNTSLKEFIRAPEHDIKADQND